MPGCQDTKEFFSRMGPVESPTCDDTTPAPQAEIATPPPATPIPTTTPIPTDIEAPTTLDTQSQQAQAFSIPLRDIGEGTADSTPAPVSETADAAVSPPATAQPTPTVPQIKVVDTPKPAEQKTPSAVSPELKELMKDPEQDSDAAIQQALLQAMQEQKETEQQQEKQPQTTTDGLIKPPPLAEPSMTTPSFSH